jgi:hypothetical protein
MDSNMKENSDNIQKSSEFLLEIMTLVLSASNMDTNKLFVDWGRAVLQKFNSLDSFQCKSAVIWQMVKSQNVWISLVNCYSPE